MYRVVFLGRDDLVLFVDEVLHLGLGLLLGVGPPIFLPALLAVEQVDDVVNRLQLVLQPGLPPVVVRSHVVVEVFVSCHTHLAVGVVLLWPRDGELALGIPEDAFGL